MAGENIIAKALQLTRKTNPSGFYSKAVEEAMKLAQAKGTPEQMRAMLLKQGVKPDELKWTGFDKWAAGKKQITRDEAADFLKKNAVPLEERTLGAQKYESPYKIVEEGNGYNAAQELSERGIPGVKYLDKRSRISGDGTSNYVVFDPKNIDILRRYADGGSVGE